MKREESLQIAVSNYLRLQYPDVIFTAESSGLKLTMGQAVKAKKLRSSRGLPDMIILEPRKGYNGLCLELKTKSPRLKNGLLSTTAHIQEQHEILRRLNNKGYLAGFVVGFDAARTLIDTYMN